ncbi:hypothetical protein KFE25_013014 [Diacronema lutheri]|uniref:C2H2-type domain-containing protein n=2 Tax=Diacronema lutheri TaxID=2081491 RepID=A0A8J5X4S9_DIALT|nr:hypothetical protein KFE25_013014 [Diacronema lutheri]
MSSLHAADVAFTKKAVAPVRADSTPFGRSAQLEFVSNSAPQPAQRTAKTADILNPLFCAACNKVFAKETVFHAHKSGRKHISALQAMGMFEQAEAEQAKASAAALSSAALKREAGDAGDSAAPAKRLAREADAAAAQADGRAREAAPQPARPMPPPPVEHEWWKGTVHAKPKGDARQDGPAAPAESSGDWLCVSQRCTGVQNARNAPHCKACGALRRLGTHAVRAGQRDSVNDYARRT